MTTSNSTKFVYSEQLNAVALNELFGSDYNYVITVFNSVVKELTIQWDELERAYRHNDLICLRSIAHKCKTLYAYTGFSTMQSRLKLVEQLCNEAGQPSLQLTAEMEHLCLTHPSALLVLEDEIQRLKSFV